MTTETMPVAVPVETVTPIKPSEAIRLGCLIAPVQAFGHTHTSGGGSCAIGAMELGLGFNRFEGDERFEALRDSTPMDVCPVNPTHLWPRTGENYSTGWSAFAGPTVVAHLNDDHRWSRERIADWLAEQGL